jgi:CheY-like chemotaxis protein
MVECGKLINRQSHIMGLLLDDLLELSRITSGKLELRRSRVDGKAVVDAAVEAVRPAIDAKSHALTVTMPDGPVSFVADPLRLSQVLINLLANAAKYTDPGGRIALVVRRSDSHVWFEVTDNGIGLAPEMRPDLFAIFLPGEGHARSIARRPRHRPRAVEGPGRAARRTHRGRERRPRARIDLSRGHPVRGDGAGRPCRRPMSRRSPRDRRRDSAACSSSTTTATSRARWGWSSRSKGTNSRSPTTASRRWPVAETFRPEAAFVDIGMPRMDGYQVAARLRGTDWGREMLLVATTGWGSAGDKQRALDAGFDLHLTKPVSPDELANLLAARMGASGGDASRRAIRAANRLVDFGRNVAAFCVFTAPFGEYTRTLTPRTSCVLCVVVTYMT